MSKSRRSNISTLSFCFGKDPLTATQALDVEKRMNRRGRNVVQKYRCPHCGHYHVGGRTDKKGNLVK